MQRNFYQTPYFQTAPVGESVVVPQTVEPEPDPVRMEEPQPQIPQSPDMAQQSMEGNRVALYNPETKRFLDRFCIDDIILIAVIILLATDSEADIAIIGILAVLFLTGLGK